MCASAQESSEKGITNMGVMDKFLNAMRLNSDEDEYFDDEYYDEEEEEEYAPKRFSRRDRKAKEQEQPAPAPAQPVREEPKPAPAKITPMRSARRSQNSQATMEVCVIKPTSVEDAREITETLLLNRTVVLNLEGV